VVDVVPLFLGAGGHVRKDLPVRAGPDCASGTRPCTWTLRPPQVSCGDGWCDAMAAIAPGQRAWPEVSWP
jgi:hypothetical protein